MCSFDNLKKGYIRLYRSLIKWKWHDNPIVVSTFIHILCLANYEDNEWHDITIKRGSFITSMNNLSEKIGISTQNLKTALKKLQSTNEISIKSTNKFSIITICNYESYQGLNIDNQQTTNKQLTNNQQTTNKQLTTTNKYNKYNKLKIKKYRVINNSHQNFSNFDKNEKNNLGFEKNKKSSVKKLEIEKEKNCEKKENEKISDLTQENLKNDNYINSQIKLAQTNEKSENNAVSKQELKLFQCEVLNDIKSNKKFESLNVAYDTFKNHFNDFAKNYNIPTIRQLDKRRITAVNARLREHGKESLKEVFDNIRNSEFLRGETGWQISFDWIFNKTNYLKILEGNYKDRIQKNALTKTYENTLIAMKETIAEQYSNGVFSQENESEIIYREPNYD